MSARRRGNCPAKQARKLLVGLQGDISPAGRPGPTSSRDKDTTKNSESKGEAGEDTSQTS